MRRLRPLPPLPRDDGFWDAVGPLWRHPAVQSMARYPQHGEASCLSHCLAVAYLSYRCCLRRGLDARAAARGGLLHDLFLYDWHTYRPARGEGLHGFTHPRRALENARRYFALTPVEEDVILRHMWPLTPRLPATAEGRVVTMVDKYVSLLETFRRPASLEPGALLLRWGVLLAGK